MASMFWRIVCFALIFATGLENDENDRLTSRASFLSYL